MRREVNGIASKGSTSGESRIVRGRISFGRQTFRSFKNSTYRIYFFGLLGEMGAMNMQMLARSLLIYRLTDSATILGIMSLAHAIPMLALSLYGGLIADRMQKKYVMLVGQAASAAVSLMVAVLLSSGYLSVENTGSWWILVFNSLLQGTIMALVMPSRQAVLPEIVGGEQLMNAVSLSNMGMNVLRLVAPALTGFLIDAFDFAAVFYTMTVLYLMAVLFISFLPRTSTITAQSSNAWTGIKEGIKYIKNEITILLILVFILFIVLLSMPYQTLMPIFTEDILEVGATGMGVLMSVSGIGAMFGSIVLASLPNKKRGLLLLLSSIFLSLALVGFSFSTSWHLSLVLVAFVGLGQTGRMTLGNTLLQYYVDNDYRGRVMSIYLMEFGITSLGTFAASILAEVIGPEWSVGGFALVLVCLSILALIFVPRLRRLD